ncbi:MAG TPA: hypothetical protein VNF07_05000 [Acidimicrobiales bacterium]|nr:hypothetical protein [Acidimicrobiales bacterium]
MRAFLLLVAAVCVAIGGTLAILIGAGDTKAVSSGDISRLLDGVLAYPDAQFNMALYDPGDPAADFYETLDLSTTARGATLEGAAGKVNAEFFLYLERDPLLEVIGAGHSAYFWADFSLLRPAFPTRREQAALKSLQSEIGKRWVRVPTGLLGSAAPATPIGAVAEQRLVSALEQSVREHVSLGAATSPDGYNGVVVSGPLSSVFDPLFSSIGSLVPAFGRLVPGASFPKRVPGGYRLGFYADRSGVLRQIDLHVDRDTGVGVLVNHSDLPIYPPYRALPFPRAALGNLVALAGGLAPAGLLGGGFL